VRYTPESGHLDFKSEKLIEMAGGRGFEPLLAESEEHGAPEPNFASGTFQRFYFSVIQLLATQPNLIPKQVGAFYVFLGEIRTASTSCENWGRNFTKIGPIFESQ